MLPIDFEAQEPDVEFAGLLLVEHPQDGNRRGEFHGASLPYSGEGKMKGSSLILGAIAVAAAGASIYLGTQLSAAREALAQETAARSGDAARIHELEARLSGIDGLHGSALPPPAAPPRVTGPDPRPMNRSADVGTPPWMGRGENMANVYNTPAGQNE